MEDFRNMVDELLDRGSLSKWEDSFLTSLSDKIDRHHRLSELEIEKLKEIYEDELGERDR